MELEPRVRYAPMSSPLAAGGRPRRFLFFLYHTGYLRHYAAPVRLLAEQGHVIHLAFTVIEKDSGDRRLAEDLAAEQPGVTFGRAPTRSYFDGWRRTSIVVRAFTDLARYANPRYREATALRARMAQKIKLQIATAKSDPFTGRFLSELVDRVATMSDAEGAERLLRRLAVAEAAIPTSGRIDRFIADFRPDAVLATPLVDFASNQVDYLKSAARAGIPTGVCVASWDNLTNKGLLRFLPDRVFIWNEHQRRELEEFHGVPGERAVVTGAQKFDEWFERRPSRSAEELEGELGLDASRPFLLYVCSSAFIAPDEVTFVRRWLEALRSSDDPLLREIGVCVRPHPQNAEQWRGVDLGSYGNVVVSPAAGAWPDAGRARADFFDVLTHAAAVVGINTSAMIESAIVGRNVLTILDPAFAGTQEGTLHFHYLLRENGGFLSIARSLDEHREQLATVLASGPAEQDNVQEFIRTFVRPHGLDVPAAPLVAEGLLELACSTPEPRPAPPASVHVLRLALLVPTAVVSLLTLVGAGLHRLARTSTPKPPQAAADRHRQPKPEPHGHEPELHTGRRRGAA